MNSVLALLFGLLPLAFAEYSQFIVGGYEARIEDFKYQGSLQYSDEHTCGCVLVSPRWAISAAHCGGNPSHTVSFGSRNTNNGVVMLINRVTFHPNYGYGQGYNPNDISVIEFKEPISGANIAPMPLGRWKLMGGERAVISGWGLTCELCEAAVNLRAAELDVLSHGECTMYWNRRLNPDSHVCVMDKTQKLQGSCSGDSGGPMISGNEVHGVTSWGGSSCSGNRPSVYTRVTSYRAWICKESNKQILGC